MKTRKFQVSEDKKVTTANSVCKEEQLKCVENEEECGQTDNTTIK